MGSACRHGCVATCFLLLPPGSGVVDCVSLAAGYDGCVCGAEYCMKWLVAAQVWLHRNIDVPRKAAKVGKKDFGATGIVMSCCEE